MRIHELVPLHNSRHPASQVELRRTEGGEILLAISGELDMKVSTDLAPVLEAALFDCPSHSRFYLDMERVDYISSTGIGLLSSILMQGQKRSISLILVHVPPKVRNVMDVLGLLAFFREGEPETRSPT